MAPLNFCGDDDDEALGNSRDIRNNFSNRDSPSCVAATAEATDVSVDSDVAWGWVAVALAAASAADLRAARLVSRDWRKTRRNPSRESVESAALEEEEEGGGGGDGRRLSGIRDLYHSLKLCVGFVVDVKKGDLSLVL